ncbi:MAG: arylamine N-acetyltransferase [Eubacterium sp.]|nr:arylamine N-acetyltransferase [Eubacterium sp.]
MERTNPFAGLYEPIPDANAYLDRIEVKKEEPSPAFLSKIMWGHLSHIPFEDLEVYEDKRTPSLNTADLFDKLVTRKRGGYCFEQNGLLVKALAALGFDAFCVGVRITYGAPFLMPIRHRGIVVTLEGKRYYVDVGFGGPSPVSPVLIDEKAGWQQSGERQYRAEVKEGEVFIYARTKDFEGILFRFDDKAADEVDFTSWNLSTSVPGSHFADMRILNLYTDTGYRKIEGDMYEEKDGDEVIKTELKTPEEITACLKDKFGVVK